MPLPVVGLFPWLVSLFAVILRSVFSWVMSFVALKYAARITLGTGMLVAIAGITLGVAVAVKAIIYGAQYAMPSSLGAATYFLPNNINVIIGAYVAMRTTWVLYHWTYDRIVAIARLGAV